MILADNIAQRVSTESICFTPWVVGRVLGGEFLFYW